MIFPGQQRHCDHTSSLETAPEQSVSMTPQLQTDPVVYTCLQFEMFSGATGLQQQDCTVSNWFRENGLCQKEVLIVYCN